MNFRQTLIVLLKWSPLVAALAVIGGVIGFTTGSSRTTYSSTAVVYVGTQTPSTDPAQVNNLFAFDQMLASLSTMVSSRPIATLALAQPGVDRSVGQVVAETTSTAVPNTDLINITVTDSSPTVAAELANRMANALITYTSAAPRGDPAAVITEPIRMFSAAGGPGTPVAVPSRTKRVLEGAALGAVVAVLALLIIESLREAQRRPTAADPSTAGPDDI